MKKLLALLLTICLPIQAANTFGTDASDLWFNPNESGWGINVTHQQEVLFITLFVYGADSRTRWYVGPNLRFVGGSTFTGELYETIGPFLGGAFNPNAVSARQVGTANMTFSNFASATLTYSVDGVNVAKSIQRQTFRTQNLTGTYVGAVIGTQTGCGPQNQFVTPGDLVVSQQGASISMSGRAFNSTQCTYVGTYSQFGRMGQINAALSCGGGATGTIVIYEIEASPEGFLSLYQADYGTCREIGRIGGMRR